MCGPLSLLHQQEYPCEAACPPDGRSGTLPVGRPGPRGCPRAWAIVAVGTRRGLPPPVPRSKHRRAVFPSARQAACPGAQARVLSQVTASLRDVKKRVGQGGTCTPRKKFARTRSTGDLPNRAMREALQGMDQTALASRLTEPTAVISTSMACCFCWQTSLTFAIAARASST